MIGFGVPPVANKPYQVVISTPGTPASARVGTSGNWDERAGDITARGLSLPDLMCGIDEDVVSNIISTWLPIRSRCAWLLPL